MEYYQLTDPLRFGQVIRADGRRHYRFVFGTYQWERTTLFQAYLTEGTPLFGRFRPLTEEESQKQLLENARKLASLLEKADRLAAQAHKGQTDKAGEPYIEHPRAVAKELSDWEEKIVALLHDVVEDTHWTVEGLQREGFAPTICQAVDLLTKKPGQPYGEYLENLRNNRLARNVKLMDLSHNMDLRRIPNPTPRDHQRVEKYKKARKYLYGDIPSLEEGPTGGAQIPALEICKQVKAQAFQGRMVPGDISWPVLRRWQDKMCLAFFLYTYSREDLLEGKISRPESWILADLESGAVLARHSCREEDFSEAPWQEKYAITGGGGQSEGALAMLDGVRREYAATGTVPQQAYRTYLEQVLRAIPPAYHRFYRELSI